MKNPKLLSIPLLTLFIIGQILSYTENSQSQTQIEIENIDLAIDALNHQLEQLRKEALNQEMEAQPYMRYHWKEFSKDIDHAEEREKKILEIKEKIQKLRERKNSLTIPL